MVRYRTETFSGLGERDIVDVMRFETFELGNTDILETLQDGVLKGNPICDQFSPIIKYLEGENDELKGFECIAEQTEFFKNIVDEIIKVTGYNLKYALWLADKEAVTDKTFYGKEMLGTDDYDSYEVGPVVLSELGYDGTLYGYEHYPKPLDRALEKYKNNDLKEILGLLDIENEIVFENYDDAIFDKIADLNDGYSKNLIELLNKYKDTPENLKMIDEVLQVFGCSARDLLFVMGQEIVDSLRDDLKDVIDASENDHLTVAQAEKLDEEYFDILNKIQLLENINNTKDDFEVFSKEKLCELFNMNEYDGLRYVEMFCNDTQVNVVQELIKYNRLHFRDSEQRVPQTEEHYHKEMWTLFNQFGVCMNTNGKMVLLNSKKRSLDAVLSELKVEKSQEPFILNKKKSNEILL